MNYNYIIIEDSKGALENLRFALKTHPELKELGHASNAQQGIAMALRFNPHIIFLDVELGADNGFDVLKEIKQHSGELPFFIMTTDFDKYAKNAVNANALYFLDKPIDPDELAIAVTKIQKRFLDLQDFMTIKNSEGHYFIDLRTVRYISSSDNYCIIHRLNANSMVVTRTLKDIEAILPSNFVRIHKSHIVNRNFVQMMNTTTRIVRLNFKEESTNKEKELPIGNLYLEKTRRILLSY